MFNEAYVSICFMCSSKCFIQVHTFLSFLIIQPVLLGLGGVNRLVHTAEDVRGHVNHPPLPDDEIGVKQLGMTQHISRSCPQTALIYVNITFFDTKKIQISVLLGLEF